MDLRRKQSTYLKRLQQQQEVLIIPVSLFVYSFMFVDLVVFFFCYSNDSTYCHQPNSQVPTNKPAILGTTPASILCCVTDDWLYLGGIMQGYDGVDLEMNFKGSKYGLQEQDDGFDDVVRCLMYLISLAGLYYFNLKEIFIFVWSCTTSVQSSNYAAIHFTYNLL